MGCGIVNCATVRQLWVSNTWKVLASEISKRCSEFGNRHSQKRTDTGTRYRVRRVQMRADFRIVSVGYFQTMGMRLAQGRLFTNADRDGATPVAVINETFARTHWPGEDPVGKRFRNLNTSPDRATTRFLTVIGVGADAKNRAITDAVWPEAFIPLAQHAATFGAGGDGLERAFNLAVSTLAHPSSEAAATPREGRGIEQGFIISQVRSMDEILAAVGVCTNFTAILQKIISTLLCFRAPDLHRFSFV